MKLLLFLFISFIVLYLTLFLIGLKFDNPYKLIMIFGKKGSGKTTYFTKLALKYINKGYTVYSNCNIYGTRVFNVEDFGHKGFEQNSVILIDEVKTIWDSRDFKKFDKKVRDQFIYQRHDKLIIYLASQQFNVDKTIRDLCDELYLLVNYFNIFSVAKKINKRITIHKSDDENSESFLTEDFSFSLPFDWHFTFIPRYIYFFDSFESKPKENISYVYPWHYDPFLKFISKSKGYRKYLKFKLTHRINKYTQISEIIYEIKELYSQNPTYIFKISKENFNYIKSFLYQ